MCEEVGQEKERWGQVVVCVCLTPREWMVCVRSRACVSEKEGKMDSPTTIPAREGEGRGRSATKAVQAHPASPCLPFLSSLGGELHPLNPPLYVSGISSSEWNVSWNCPGRMYPISWNYNPESGISSISAICHLFMVG